MKNIIPWAKPVFSKKERKYVSDVINSTWISGGNYVNRLESYISGYCGTKHSVAVSNGTASLYLALLSLDIGHGDEVIVPGFTFVAPVNMVIAVGAKPVYVDINSQTWCIDVSKIEKHITSKTKAIIAVHVFGNVCDMDTLKNIADKHRLAIIEDTAESPFSKYKNKYAGTFGDIGCFSFHAAKTITTGEGGMCLTNNKALFNKIKILHDQGMRKGKRYWHDVVGFNFRLTNLQGAIGCAQFEKLEKIISGKKKVYQLYKKYLMNEEGITMQYFRPEVDPVVWVVAIKLEPYAFKGNRDYVVKKLIGMGIETRPGFYPFSVMPIYKASKLAVSEDIGLNVISLPSHILLKKKEIEFICAKLKSLRKKKGK